MSKPGPSVGLFESALRPRKVAAAESTIEEALDRWAIDHIGSHGRWPSPAREPRLGRRSESSPRIAIGLLDRRLGLFAQVHQRDLLARGNGATSTAANLGSAGG